MIKKNESNEGTYLIEDQSNGCCSVEKGDLPKWCYIDLDNYKENMPFIMKLFKRERMYC